MSHVPIKKTKYFCRSFHQKQKNFSRTSGLLQLHKTPLRKRINSLKDISNVKMLLYTKNDIHREYKSYRNKLSTVMKKKVKESIIMIISELILKILKTHGKA